jgi:GNAT superfamily N-acetyltransferase
MRLKEAAGWNQTENDWRMLLSLAPDSCFGVECEGVLAATTTAVLYGKELAWIGMVLTAPEFRKRGLAHMLMSHTLDDLRERGVAWAKLDATDMGAGIYSDFGFQFECAIERWQRDASDSPVRESCSSDAVEVMAIASRDAFGVLRASLLEKLIQTGGVALKESGFALWRAGSFAHYFGPCVANNIRSAEQLLRCCLHANQGRSLIWDLAPQNSAAVQLADTYGFQRARRLSRMACALRADAKPLRPEMNSIVALAGFEYG